MRDGEVGYGLGEKAGERRSTLLEPSPLHESDEMR